MKTPIEKQGFQLRLGLGQVIMLWSLLAGLMVAVFLFGLFAGREQGLQTALSGQDVQTVRMPIAIDVAKQEDSLSATFDPSQKSLTPPVAAAPSEDSEFDFGADVEQAKQVAEEQVAKAAKEQAAAVPAVEDSKPLTIPQAVEEPELLPEEVVAVAPPKVELPPAPPAVEKPAVEVVTKPIEPVKKVEVAKKAAPEKPALDSAKVRSGWYVQLAAARTKSEAQSIQLRLTAKSYPVAVQEADVNGATYYRVLVGPYAAKSRAQSEQHTIQGLKLTSGTPFLKFIQ